MVVEILIKNKKTYDGEGEYVGRPTALSNPYKIDFRFNRKDVISYYAQYMSNAIEANDIKILYELNRLFRILVDEQKLILICHCSPKLCHAEVIRQFLLNKYHTGSYIYG